ncbi:hypothetical protein PAND9192_01767 [Photobacterium andalusiense]|uniref:Uncharacterized protein n=1 Tax=Photobacterium andalusiense TaxID=2204296 RepID=A0A1Y6MGQ3_9GAMM|nr:hypothetical protein PAND9192_01767 [Photobacterium andalusiense]
MHSTVFEHREQKHLASTIAINAWIDAASMTTKKTSRIISAFILVIIR